MTQTANRIEPIVDAIRQLSPAEKARLYDELGWVPAEVEPSDATRKMLDERWAAYQSSPDSAIPWDVAMAQVRAELHGDG